MFSLLSIHYTCLSAQYHATGFLLAKARQHGNMRNLSLVSNNTMSDVAQEQTTAKLRLRDVLTKKSLFRAMATHLIRSFASG